ncbi:MAG: hemerythrin domain-containing protein [bacterium]|nr:hemerythrin domain-containing protein [bacterium]
MEKDYIKRYVNHEVEGAEISSPMEPPEEFAPPTVEQLPREDFAKPLQQLMKEHDEYEKVLNVFDRALLELKKRDWEFNPEISAGLKSFFRFFDDETSTHNKKEERALFPLLREKLITTGEHSPVGPCVTPVDVMEEEHRQVGQLVALVFNFLGISSRLPDPASRIVLLEQALHVGQEIVETMKLHIYKENTVLFPLAQRLITPKEFLAIQEKMEEFQ